ncbi:MAG: MarR family winged helix-turn-helix transcriptional regulator [Lachnospiraceae bacterium]
MKDSYEVLKLKNQLCFPLYACSKEIVKRYKPLLDPLGLTYTQYIVMMVLWESKKMNVKTLGDYVYLDSGTLTPVLKKLEEKGYVARTRGKEDERILVVTLTKEGHQLKERAVDIPISMSRSINLNSDEMKQLYDLLYKILSPDTEQ